MNKGSVVSNFLWRFMERCGAQGVTLVVSIILGRILDPEIYGTVTLVTVFTTILQVFVDSGLGNALIQKKNADDTDFSTVFYFNMGMSFLLYALMFFSAPLIASFYSQPELVPLIRAISLILPISGVKNIQQAYVSVNMMFRKFFFATLGGTVGAAVIGITMAYMGYGVWALVAQLLFNAAVDTVILWLTVKWRPRALFSWKRLKRLLSFGWKLLVSSLIETVYNDLRKLIIGKKYTKADLAHFDRGKQFPNFIVTNLNIAIDSVLFPVMSSVKEDTVRVKQMTRSAIRLGTYIIFPLMVGFGVCAENIISLLLTEKWLFCVPYLQIFCFSFAVYPIHTANLNAIKSLGRSDIYLKLEIFKKVVGISAILISMNFGVMAIALSEIPVTVICAVINAFPCRRLIGYSFFGQMRDIFPAVIMSSLMGCAVYFVGMVPLHMMLVLLLQVVTGVVVYVVLSVVFRCSALRDIIDILKGMISKKKGENP